MDEREMIRKTLAEHPEMEAFMREALEAKLVGPVALPDDDDTTVLCGYWPSSINGSKLVLCGACGTRCCIAPSTQQSLKDFKGKLSLLCLKCFQENPPPDAPDLSRMFQR